MRGSVKNVGTIEGSIRVSSAGKGALGSIGSEKAGLGN
jgi:hypothetical protein